MLKAWKITIIWGRIELGENEKKTFIFHICGCLVGIKKSFKLQANDSRINLGLSIFDFFFKQKETTIATTKQTEQQHHHQWTFKTFTLSWMRREPCKQENTFTQFCGTVFAFLSFHHNAYTVDLFQRVNRCQLRHLNAITKLYQFRRKTKKINSKEEIKQKKKDWAQFELNRIRNSDHLSKRSVVGLIN